MVLRYTLGTRVDNNKVLSVCYEVHTRSVNFGPILTFGGDSES